MNSGMIKVVLFYFLVMTAFSACHPSVIHQIRPAFYYWRSDYNPGPEEKQYLAKAPVVYIRFFDVVWNDRIGAPVPESPLRLIQSPDSAIQYVPVVFITNETLQKALPAQMEVLADSILKKIKKMYAHFNPAWKEIQMDCDWSVGTRDKYFLLLQIMQEQLHRGNCRLSVTLRLHQIKYREKTGVPPADRCMLMFYNMGDWKNPQTTNSMYDLETASKYLNRISDYPLPLDIALPLLRWSIVYRNNKFLTFINYIAGDSLKQYSFLHPLRNEGHFLVEKDTFALGCNFRRGDVLRSESCSFRDLMEGKKQLLNRIKNKSLTLSLFHLDKQLLKYYSNEQIQKIFSTIQ